MFLFREVANARSSVRRDAKPSSGHRRGAQADAAQSIPAAKRNHNRSVARSSVFESYLRCKLTEFGPSASWGDAMASLPFCDEGIGIRRGSGNEICRDSKTARDLH